MVTITLKLENRIRDELRRGAKLRLAGEGKDDSGSYLFTTLLKVDRQVLVVEVLGQFTARNEIVNNHVTSTTGHLKE